MAHESHESHLLEESTHDLIAWAQAVEDRASSPFEAAQKIATRLGAHYSNGQAEIGFWVPELVERGGPDVDVFLQVWNPLETLDLRSDLQTVRFRRQRLPLLLAGDCAWGVIAGMRAGNRSLVGSFYELVYRDAGGLWHTILDPLAYSVPFGTFAPAEFYDVDGLQSERADRKHFACLDIAPDPDGIPRVRAPVNILQIHVSTASEEGTLSGLMRIYDTIADKLRAGQPLSPAEENYVGYDAVQLMPLEPTIEYETGPLLWEPIEDDPDAETVAVTLRRPNMTNWGYDVMLAASPAVNPAALGSGRPDELVDFIATMHGFPGEPINVIFDIVYGHADNQALPVLSPSFFAGPGMYGQEINFRHPVVRALLLEMQRRKNNFGVDGVRVDGAQDFKYWDPESQVLRHDDEYLGLMNDVVQEVAGQRYRPWMIFEDGRPWPRDDWELASTYREVTKQYPNVFQWGPLTFAHNTPFLFTFWISKWWRIREIADVGGKWITGCANHDTLRRGTQVDIDARVNTYLGGSLTEIFKNAYDNPAAKLFDYALMPGVPMDFISASMRAPWSFIRNTDDEYAVKVVSEEVRFLHWTVDAARFGRPDAFPRLKALGFSDLPGLRRFMRHLDHAVQAIGNDVHAIVRLLRSVEPPMKDGLLSVAGLKAIARAWMDDVHQYCNVSHYADDLEPERTRFNLAVREFRRARPWLMHSLRAEERVDYRYLTDGAVLVYGLRREPGDKEIILTLANMEGAPCEVVPMDLSGPSLPRGGWQLALATPGLNVEDLGSVHQPVVLHDSAGLVFTQARE